MFQSSSRQTLSDENLAALISKSNKNAFDVMYARYWKLLYALAYNQLGTKEESEDMVQNVFERIWNNRLEQKITNLKAYLTVSVRHASINYIKSQITYRKFQEYLIFQEIEKNYSTEDIINYAELQRVVNEDLKMLPEKTVSVFRMSRFESKSVRDIATELNLTEKAVEYHITKSLKFIKDQLNVYYRN